MTRSGLRASSSAFLLTLATACLAQTTVTTSSGGTSGTIPMFMGTSGIENSPISSSSLSNGYTLIELGGYQAIQANYNGASYFIGNGANVANTGHDNTGFGANIFGQLTDGHSNSGFGSQALNADMSGDYNLAIGAYSLTANTTGDENVAIGTFALIDNVSGSNNTAIGGGSLSGNTVGMDNTGVGVSALQSLQVDPTNTFLSNSNTAIGSNSLTGLVAGADNVALGDGAGDDYGAWIFPGSNTGSNTSFLTGNGNIFIGASASPQQSGDSNESSSADMRAVTDRTPSR